MSQDLWLNERFVGGSRLDQESARQAQEAAAMLGQDYVSGQLADSRRVGERAVQEASQRLATEAAIRSNMQVRDTNQSVINPSVVTSSGAYVLQEISEANNNPRTQTTGNDRSREFRPKYSRLYEEDTSELSYLSIPTLVDRIFNSGVVNRIFNTGVYVLFVLFAAWLVWLLFF